MLKKLAILLGIFLFLLPLTVQAPQPSQSTSRINILPLYRENMVANTNYTYTLNINPPDGITSVIAAIIFFNAQINGQSQNFTLRVDGKSCNNPFYYIATAYSATGNTQFYFDCSNVITKSGSYTIILRSAVNTGVISGWLDLTYMNSPKANLEIHGTEYKGGDNGKVWVQLVNSTGQYVNNAVCQASIYYPDNMPFLTLASMTYLDNGIYYYNFIVPDENGVYPVSALCYYTIAIQTETADAGTILIGDQISGSYTSTATHNNGYWKIDELLTLGTYRLDFIENFTGITQPALMTDVSVIWWGKWNGGSVGDLTISIYNYSNQTWFALPNTIPNTGGANIEVSNTISTTNLTASGLMSGGQMVLRITDTTNIDAIRSQIQTDQLVINLNSLSGDHIESVKGSGEIHVQTSDSYPIRIETLCEDESSACSYFTNDDEFNFPEGEIEDNITIFALTHNGDTDVKWQYATPYTVDCTAFYWLKFWNGTAWEDISDTLLFSSEPAKENCLITVPLILNPNGNYQERYYYHIKYDNYMKWEIEWVQNTMKNINASLYPYCQQIAQKYNITYQIPTETNNISSIMDVYLCQMTLEDFYWFYQFYDEYQSIEISGQYQSMVTEERTYRSLITQRMIENINYQNFMFANFGINVTIFNDARYIGGTEYTPSQNGSIEAQFLIGGNPVNDGTCNVSVTYPNGTTFIGNSQMTYLAGSNGIYTKSFTVPSAEGVYIADIRCQRGGNNAYTSGSFHVSPAISVDLSGITNYLITINSTTYQINQSLYSDYISLLSAINSVNITANQILSSVIALNGSVFNLTIAELSHFQQAIALLNGLNYTLNTTLEYKLDLINGTVNQINQSQTAYYLSLLGAVEGVGATLNGSITQYLVYINGTTHNLSVNEFNHYLSIIEAINSVNYTANTTLENKLDYLNSTIIPLLYEINATTDTTLTFVAQINQTILQNYLSLYNFLASLNATLELDLDLINGTVIQINDTVNNLNFTIDLSQVLAAISQVNGTVNQNQQYLISINGTAYQINGSLAGILQAIYDSNSSIMGGLSAINSNVLNLNSSEFQHYNDLYVILKDINYTTNTTLEYKLDLINYTTWQTWMMIQNLTIGNVSVTANVNWTEGVQLIWNASGQSQIDYNLLSLSDKGIQLTTETLTCLSNTTLQHILNVTNCIQGTCQNYNQAMTEACSWGCANNQCIPAPQFQYMFAIGFALILIGVIYVGWRVGK